MTAYESYMSGKLVDYEYPAEAVASAMERLPKVALPA
jgi:tryptophan synthase beta chain